VHFFVQIHTRSYLFLSISAVVEAGQRYGTVRGDIYGCLYFYLGEQLRTFAQRLSRFRIKFHVFRKDAHVLSQEISAGHLSKFYPQITKFDRVDVSNSFDVPHADIPRTLSNWGSLLKGNDESAFVGHFINWSHTYPGSSVSNSSKDTIEKLQGVLKESGRVCLFLHSQSYNDSFLSTAAHGTWW
jgi:hypothetical protein